jgi:ubiquinone/menaquinone biosynthesis C-methylase UbiE
MTVDKKDLEKLFSPLDLEQALNLLDVITWFPDDSDEKWQKIASYVSERCPDSSSYESDVYQEVLNKILHALTSEVKEPKDFQGRWTLIPEPKKLYELKYNLKTVLYPDDWFTLMNMGYANLDIEQPSLPITPSEEIMRYSMQLYHHVASAVELRDREVLEVGCGRGGGASFVKNYHHPSVLVGVDYCPNNVDFCQRKHQYPGLSFLQGDAENLPFADASFDAVINVESAHCYPSINRFFAEVYRILRPGGYFLFSDEWWRTEVDTLRTHLNNSGLEVIREEVITPNIIKALALLKEQFPDFLDRIDDSYQKKVWERFFRVRVCQNSAESYTSGRFEFLNFTLRKPN